MVIVDRHPGEEAGAYSGADDPEREDGPEDDAQDDGDDQPGDLAGAGLAAESVDEDAPAQPRDGEELRAGGNVVAEDGSRDAENLDDRLAEPRELLLGRRGGEVAVAIGADDFEEDLLEGEGRAS
jgi:hypothetical protein